MSHDLSKRSVLASLQPRREPYWSRVKAGLFVGYRKVERGEGTWIARRYNEEKKQQYKALGSLSDYDAAVKAALSWVEDLDKGVDDAEWVVADACRGYVEHLKVAKTEASSLDAEGRFKRLVYDKPLGRVMLSKLKTTELRKWLHDQVAQAEDDDEVDEEDVRRSKDSANRNLHSLKAALNLALKDRRVATDAGWKTVTPFPRVGKRRTRFLSMDERSALLKAAPADLQKLMKAVLLTAARPGELANATISDFDRKAGTLALTGKTGTRTATLSSAAIRFFSEVTRNRIANAPLLERSDGLAWDKDAWKKLFKEAVKNARLPAEIVMYHLRHAAISELIAGGMDSFLVAKLAGTSTAMIDKHYGHLRHDLNRARLDSIRIL